MGPLVQSLLYGALAITYVYAIAAKPSPYRSLWSIPFTALALFIFFSADDPAPGARLSAYGLTSMLFTQLFQGLNYIALTDVQKELSYHGRRGAMHGDAKPAPIYEADLWTRVKWSLRLICSPRAVGWTHEPASLRKVRKPKTTTRAFVISRLVSIVRNVVIYDIAGVVMRANPYFNHLRFGTPIPDMSLWEVVFWRVSYAGHLLASIASVDSLHCLWAIGCVCSGISTPNDFDPDLFGSISDAWTVRRAWGKVWHQNLRPFLTAYGAFLARRLNLPPQGKMSKILCLFVAFSLSSILHLVGEWRIAGTWTCSVYFFMSQFFAIQFEEVVLYFLRKLPQNPQTRFLGRTLGYVWTMAWFTLTLPWFAEHQIKAGFIDDGLEVTVFSNLVRKLVSMV